MSKNSVFIMNHRSSVIKPFHRNLKKNVGFIMYFSRHSFTEDICCIMICGNTESWLILHTVPHTRALLDRVYNFEMYCRASYPGKRRVTTVTTISEEIALANRSFRSFPPPQELLENDVGSLFFIFSKCLEMVEGKIHPGFIL